MSEIWSISDCTWYAFFKVLISSIRGVNISTECLKQNFDCALREQRRSAEMTQNSDYHIQVQV